MKIEKSFPCRAYLILFIVLMLSCCGYQMVKEKGIFGGEISSIYIPLFKNKTYEPHASGYVTDAFAKELVATGLFKLNKEGSDGYIQGSINKIRIIPSAMNAQGIVVEKSVDMTVDLSLFNKTGAFIKKWTLSETEIYSVNDVSSEDYNKREALRRMSGRMARKFSSIALIDY